MIIDKTAMEQAIAHLIERARAGEEGVGLLSGPIGPCPRDTDGDGDCGRPSCPQCPGRAVRWAPLANVSEFPRLRYEVDPGELLAAYNALEAEGLRPLAQVHAHLRGGASPSATDIRYATNPVLLHMIVDLSGPRPVPVLWRLALGSQPERVRYTIADLREQKNQATDLTRGVTDA